MPITGRTPKECFDQFREHVSGLISNVVPTKAILKWAARSDKNLCVLSFANPQHNNAAEVETSAGTVFLSVSQHLSVESQKDKRFRLRTDEYRYALFGGSPTQLDEPVLRWEYVSRRVPMKQGAWCRHHMQFGRVHDGRALQTQLSGHALDLNRVHLPTGWVLLEQLFRFMIHDLGMRPPCGERWQEELHRSEKLFFEEFTVQRHDPY